jgi:hypothetical protein
MNRDEAEFDPLEGGLGTMLPRLCQCPGAEALAGFAVNSLPPDETSRIQSHVSACGICDSLVERLRHFDAPIATDPPGWSATQRRLRSRAFPKHRSQTKLLHPTVAYGIALCAVVATVVSGRHRVPVARPPATAIAMESVPTIDLNVTRGGGVPRLAVDPRGKFLLLSFLIDIHPAFHYAASLDGGPNGEVVTSDGKGNFNVLFSRELLGAGRHRLTVTEINPASGKAARSFDFAFQL